MTPLQQFYEKKRILITGGAGFIGSHLVEKLVSLGAHVTVMDNFHTGTLTNLKSVVHTISLVYADVRSPYSCSKATMNKDCVFHLAALISVPDSFKNHALYHNVNVEGTINILEGCKKNNVKNMVYSSSSAVYGDKNGTCHEDDVLDPQSPYALSKQKAELACKQYAIDHNINIAILRYFNVFGERQNPNNSYASVVAKFTQQLMTNQPLTIFGDGMQTRDFIHVAHVVEANLLMGMKDTIRGEVFNIGTGTSITLFQLIERLEKDLNIKHNGITFQPARPGDILNSQAHCEKYKKIISQQ